MNKPVEHLITQHLDIWTQATEAKSTAGRGTRGKINLLGIQKLRELILEMAVRGLLVPQDPNDEPASELLKKIAAEKAQLIKDGKIKKSKPLPGISDDEKTFDLPKGWEWVRLGEVGNIFNGNSINERIKNEKYTNVEGLPFIATKDVGYGFVQLNYDNGVNIPIGEPKFMVAHSGAVLLCAEGGSAGKKCGITDKDICFGNKLFANELFASIGPKFILAIYLSPSFYEKFSAVMTGIIGGISRANFINLPIQLPPLVEQNRIVSKVDELMALCDALETQTLDSMATHQTLVETLLASLVQSAPSRSHVPRGNADPVLTASTNIGSHVQHVNQSIGLRFHQAWWLIEQHFDVLFTTEPSINTLKQTILQLAVMGKLVPQDPNDEPASELLKKIAAEKAQLIKDGKIKKSKPLPPITDVEKPFNLPSGWEWVRLGDAIDVRDGTHDSPKDAISGITYPLVTSKNFSNGDIDFEGARRISEKDHQLIIQRSKVDKYDILFSMIGGNIGNQVMVKCDTEFSIKNVALFKYFDKALTSPFFFKIYTENLANSLQNEALGGAQPFVSLGKLRSLVLALPPKQEQTRIVAKVNQLMTLCDQIKIQLQTAQHTQAQLAQTITQEALG
jgi:type I restriction enzyme S subunit